jgi:hypothetical protein
MCLRRPVFTRWLTVEQGQLTCADEVAVALLPDPVLSGSLYGTTGNPKNSFPNGKFNAAGTTRPSSRVSFVTTRGLLTEQRVKFR